MTGTHGRYDLEDPEDCGNIEVTGNGQLGISYDHVDSENPLDRSAFPNRFAYFLQSGVCPRPCP